MELDNFKPQLFALKKNLLWLVPVVLAMVWVVIPPASATAVCTSPAIKTDTVRVKGTIQTIDAQTGKTEKVPSVIIRIKETQSAVVTNGNGDFRFTYIPGRDTITLIIADQLYDKKTIMLTNVHLQDEIDMGKIMLKQAPPSQQEPERRRSKRRKKG